MSTFSNKHQECEHVMGKAGKKKDMVEDRWCERDVCVCVTEMCVEVCVCQSFVRERCDKVACERLCVKQLCAPDLCVKELCVKRVVCVTMLWVKELCVCDKVLCE